jgi:hypothetical protein
MTQIFRQTWFRIIFVFACLTASPFLYWLLAPSAPLQVWILDKTVPTPDYREHKGLMWLLNHQKIRNAETNKAFQYDQDYYGFFPKSGETFDIRDLPQDSEKKPDLVYITDTYGVLDGDFYTSKPVKENNPLIYGGLTAKDLNSITDQLTGGTTLVAEFNTLASPTKGAQRNQLEELLGVDWRGWMGRYYPDLSRNKEVPAGVIQNYEKQQGHAWNYSGAGFLLISDDQRIIVLEQGKDVGAKLLSFAFEPAFRDEFKSKASIPYYSWFEFGYARSGADVLASYHFDATTSGLDKLKAAGLSADFPAVVRKKNADYTGYYFAGDFADNNQVPSRWNIGGMALLKGWLTSDIPGETDAFYWNVYHPLMKKILREVTDNHNSFKQSAASISVHEEAGTKQISMVKDGHLTVFDGSTWQPKFWNGINLGATTPGHYPGELSPTKEDYLRWFPQMKQMNINVMRVYTVLPPIFYEALDEFNRGRKDPLLLLQGIWTPEEELIGEDLKGNDAYREDIHNTFAKEITNAVKVIHGDISLPIVKGHAGGDYRTDVSKWLLGWVIGTEWYPYAVKVTNDGHPGMPPFKGTYFQASADASPFESWLAGMLETAAEEEMKYGWQHPISFTNWLTTDPLQHPNEPAPQEDLVSVDPMHISPSSAWTAGYFASYHVYPYYPDFLRFEESYQTYKDAQGKINPYAGYLHDLRKHHKGIPLIVAEFGVPSSRGMAHYGPGGLNQGMHTEEEQGRMNADMIRAMYDEAYDGALLFAWQDEWFKFTWNTIDYEIPGDRRAMWRNRLTNEENFGVIAVEPGASSQDMIVLDGKTNDWDRRKHVATQSYDAFDMKTSHDEAYLYLMMKKKQGAWNLTDEPVTIGFDTLQGGSHSADKAPAFQFREGIEFLLQLKGDKDSRIMVNSAYDQHTWLYGANKSMIPADPKYAQEELGIFLPWKLAINKSLYLPQTKVTMPFEELEVGLLRKGRTDPAAADFDTLADWYVKDDVLELRIPWMLLGYTDPSSKLVWDYPYKAGSIMPVPSTGIHIEPYNGIHGTLISSSTAGKPEPLFYTWDNWDEPVHHERQKQSYDIVRQIYGELKAPKSAP